jgi:hypothetical protein
MRIIAEKAVSGVPALVEELIENISLSRDNGSF